MLSNAALIWRSVAVGAGSNLREGEGYQTGEGERDCVLEEEDPQMLGSVSAGRWGS